MGAQDDDELARKLLDVEAQSKRLEKHLKRELDRSLDNI